MIDENKFDDEQVKEAEDDESKGDIMSALITLSLMYNDERRLRLQKEILDKHGWMMCWSCAGKYDHDYDCDVCRDWMFWEEPKEEGVS